MKSIAFYNNKGGVGKTTSVINIAFELATETRVLVIDIDGQANCSRFFTDNQKEGLDKALVNADISPENALCSTRYENIDIITARNRRRLLKRLFLSALNTIMFCLTCPLLLQR